MPASDPYAELVRMARASLAAAGLERRALGEDVYWIGGADDAPPIVLVHGANDHAGTWAPVVPALLGSTTLAERARTRGEGDRPKQFKLLIVDLPAHGESGPRGGPVTVPSIVERLGRVIDRELGTRPFTLVGNSLGSWIALLYVLANPSRVERLVLESGGGLARPLGAPLLPKTRDEAIETMRAVHGPDVPIVEWAVAALLERGAHSPVMQILQTDWTDHFVDARLAEIQAPTTLIRGSEDTMVPPAYADALLEGIAGAKKVTIDGAAHIPHVQRPEDFIRCLMAIF